MSRPDASLLDRPVDPAVDPDEYVRAAVAWHFDPLTGSPFWLARAKELEFDPLTDVRGVADLALFPNVAGELRDVPVEDLVPAGYGSRPEVIGFFESGGTTGAPKRVPLLADWCEELLRWSNGRLDEHGVPRDLLWLGVTPSGPHVVGEFFRRSARSHGRGALPVDLDPRWVRGRLAAGRAEEMAAYAEHVVDQVAELLRSQDIGVMVITPPLLERLVRRDELVELVTAKVRAIRWGGTQLDADSYAYYRTELFPDTVMCGNYGSTMIVGLAAQRPAEREAESCVFDAPSPGVFFRVVDEETGASVPLGERGRVVANHVTRSFFLPNNLERDTAVRVAALAGPGDAVADIAPVARFEDEDVIEGVY